MSRINADKHILVVDDSPQIREFLHESVLEPQGYRVSLADNGHEGLELALNLHPDVMLLDYDMPKMNGIEVLRALKNKEVTIPVILITSCGSETVAINVFRLGAWDYIRKPFAINEILERIRNVLQIAKLKQERDDLLKRLTKTNRQLAQRLKELDTLYRISKVVTTLRERERLLERIVDAAMYITGAMDGHLMLLDTTTGLPNKSLRRELRGKDYQTPHKAHDIKTASLGLMLVVPLQIGQRVIGALTVSNKRNRQPLGKHDHRMLRLLADYAAIAIENFRLVAEIEERREQEKEELRNLYEHYISTPIAAHIKRPQGIQLGGKRQDIAVLFADLRGFTTFTTRASPETLMAVLNRLITGAADAVREENGTIDKFMGDEVMAFFNAPDLQEDYSNRAIRAAWRILDITQRAHKQFPVDQRLNFGIGIATGEAIVGNVGTPRLMSFTVVGHTVNKAHALQELAPANKILICYNTYQSIRDVVQVRELPPVQIKGQQHPEALYEVIGVEL